MSRIGIIAVIAIGFFLVGCDKKIDTTSDDSTKTSIQKVKESLSGDKQKEFEDAIKIIAYSKVNLKDIMLQGQNASTNIHAEIKSVLNGKTADQVIAEANKIRSEQLAREKTQALEEIKELEQKQQASLKSVEELKKVQVIRSRFSLVPQKYGNPKPLIELTVRNGLDKAISRIYFVGTISSEGRSIPWLKEQFNYEISGGLEPNENGIWDLAPNMFSKWGKVDAPSDAIFTVVVEKVDGADGKTMYSTNDFTEKQQERLNELKKKYGVQ